jgi:hypothetical protein
MGGVQLSRDSAVCLQIHVPRSFILSVSFFCSRRCAISLVILPMRSIRSSSDCAMLRARGLAHISMTYPATYSSRGLRGNPDAPRADEVPVPAAAVDAAAVD